MVITMSASFTASLTEAAFAAPAAITGSSAAALRSNAVTLSPALTRLRAMGPPILPTPMNAMFVMRCSRFPSRRRIQFHHAIATVDRLIHAVWQAPQIHPVTPTAVATGGILFGNRRIEKNAQRARRRALLHGFDPDGGEFLVMREPDRDHPAGDDDIRGLLHLFFAHLAKRVCGAGRRQNHRQDRKDQAPHSGNSFVIGAK